MPVSEVCHVDGVVWSVLRYFVFCESVLVVARNLTAEALRYDMHCQKISQFYLHTHAFIHK